MWNAVLLLNPRNLDDAAGASLSAVVAPLVASVASSSVGAPAAIQSFNRALSVSDSGPSGGIRSSETFFQIGLASGFPGATSPRMPSVEPAQSWQAAHFA